MNISYENATPEQKIQIMKEATREANEAQRAVVENDMKSRIQNENLEKHLDGCIGNAVKKLGEL